MRDLDGIAGNGSASRLEKEKNMSSNHCEGALLKKRRYFFVPSIALASSSLLAIAVGGGYVRHEHTQFAKEGEVNYEHMNIY
jgi:hypothetical protein